MKKENLLFKYIIISNNEPMSQVFIQYMERGYSPAFAGFWSETHIQDEYKGFVNIKDFKDIPSEDYFYILIDDEMYDICKVKNLLETRDLMHIVINTRHIASENFHFLMKKLSKQMASIFISQNQGE